MLEDRKIMETSYVEQRENVYVLFVEIMQNAKSERRRAKIIDAYEGEVGKRYAENMLFRFANEELRRTKFAEIEWEKEEKFLPEGKTIVYKKYVDEGNYAVAYMRWYAHFVPGDLLFVPIGNML